MSVAVEALHDAWMKRWPEALAAWSRFTKLSSPRWCQNVKQEREEHLDQSFAMIRLADHTVVISLRQVLKLGIEDFPVEIMAHEIGHHVFCPGDLADHGRMIARMQKALPTLEDSAGYVANLYADLLINDRLQRHSNLDLGGVYRALGAASKGKPGSSRLWDFYMRTYEVLWRCESGSLVTGSIDDQQEVDSQLAARLIRHYAKDWAQGAGGYALLCLPYLLEDQLEGAIQRLGSWHDTGDAGGGGVPDGLAELGEGEDSDPVHPRDDPNINGTSDTTGESNDAAEGGTEVREVGRGDSPDGGKGWNRRYREPGDYADLLRAAGVDVTEAEAAMQYYRERAVPHLIRFPTREIQESSDPLPEGLEIWDIGSPVERVDWFESVLRNPRVIPGYTTLERTFGTTAGSSPEREAPDIYIGIDCSGSMPNPQIQLSYPVLAGTIIALSALRAGARVMVVLSGHPGSMASTDGFVSTESEVLATLTNYLGTGYAFGIPLLEKTFHPGQRLRRGTHIMIITDSDICSMLGEGHGAQLGWTVAKVALEQAGAGGTYVLHMPFGWGRATDDVERMQSDGWGVHQLSNWEELIEFARAFSKTKYEGES